MKVLSIFIYLTRSTFIIDFLMEQIPTSNERRAKQSKPFYCLCSQSSRRYTNNIALRNHVKTKHNNERQLYDAHVKDLEMKLNQQKIKFSEDLQQLELKDIAFNINDIKKLSIVNKTILSINKVYGNEGLYDPHEEDQLQSYQEDINGELNIRDIKIIHMVQQLIEIYSLEKLFESPGAFPELDFCQDQSGYGKVISMKKELSQFYCIEWASRIHLQLDLFAMQIWSNLSHEEVTQIHNCQKEMWGDYYQMVPILSEYYEEIVGNYSEK